MNMENKKCFEGDGGVEECAKVYTEAIIAHLKEEDSKIIASSTAMFGGCEVELKLRASLIDSMISFAVTHDLNAATLHRAVRMSDIVISKEPTLVHSYSLLAAVCLFIAAKYEQRKHKLQIHMLLEAFKLAGKISKQEFQNKEWRILGLLNFNAGFPIVTEYTDYMLEKAVPKTAFLAKKAAKLRHLSSYLLELVLPELAIVEWSSHDLAAAAIGVAVKLLCPNGPAEKTPTSKKGKCVVCTKLEVRCVQKSFKCCDIEEFRLYPLMKMIAETLLKSITKQISYKAAEQKYRAEEYEKVSKRKAFRMEVVEGLANFDLSVFISVTQKN